MRGDPSTLKVVRSYYAGVAGAVSDGSSPDRPIYTIGAVERMLDVPASTLRSWEERYGVVIAQRSGGRHRLYSRDQVAQLGFVKAQMDAGLQAGDAHRLLEERLAAGDPFEDPAPPLDGPRARLVVLLAERDPYAAELSEYFLRTEGYEVEATFDPDSARSAFASLNPPVVVVELLLEGGDGTELVADISGRGGRVLAVAPLDLEAAALDAGAEAFLRKPFDALRLVSAVRDLLGTSALVSRRGRA
jgi:DNA-binding transcriptional MerR regulator